MSRSDIYHDHGLLVSTIVVCLTITGILAPLSPGYAQYTPEEVQQLVQTPVAVDKAVEAGLPAQEVERIAQALNRGRIDPSNFNKTIHNAPYMAERLGDITSVGDFVTAQVEAGLRGEELARAIHGKLNSLGIPAGGHDEAGPPPIARNFIPDRAKQAIERSQPERRQPERTAPAERRGPSNRPGLGNTGSPADGPGVGPRGGGPAGGGGARGGGRP